MTKHFGQTYITCAFRLMVKDGNSPVTKVEPGEYTCGCWNREILGLNTYHGEKINWKPQLLDEPVDVDVAVLDKIKVTEEITLSKLAQRAKEVTKGCTHCRYFDFVPTLKLLGVE